MRPITGLQFPLLSPPLLAARYGSAEGSKLRALCRSILFKPTWQARGGRPETVTNARRR